MGKIGHYLAGLDYYTITNKVVDDLQLEVKYNSDPKVIANASSQEAIVMKARLGLAQQTLDRIDRLTAL